MILCIDDDPLTRAMVELVLEQDGYRCRAVSLASEAIEILKGEYPPDLVVLDLDLPDANGFELFDQIRELPGHSRTPIVILSSSKAVDDIKTGLIKGAEDYLLKPIAPALLLAKVQVAYARELQRTPARSATLASCPREVAKAARNPDNLIDKYIVVEELGEGAMGTVSKAWDTTLDNWTALKFLRPTIDPVRVERLFREARTVFQLNHANICRVLDLRKHGERYYIAMQYLDGEGCDRKFEPREAARIIEAIARAAHYAHNQGVLHRDIKPENLIVDKKGKPWITDFGISTNLSMTDKLTPTGLVLGSPAYMAPEYLVAGSEASRQTEVYSLGATLYHMLIGQMPYEGVKTGEIFERVAVGSLDRPTKYQPGLPLGLEEITMRAMHNSTDTRYESAEQLADELQAFRAGERRGSTTRRWRRKLLGD